MENDPGLGCDQFLCTTPRHAGGRVCLDRYHSKVSNVVPLSKARPQVLEFFAGIGLARMGLERAGFHVAWSNDFEPRKQSMYEGHFKDDENSSDHTFVLGDVGEVDAADLPTDVDMAWASSPCTDLSLAGGRAGLSGAASGTFWHFIRILRDLGETRPDVVVLENVTGLATSNGGDDISAAIKAFNKLGYSIDVLVIDARRFVPQSRSRLFLIGAINPPKDTTKAESNLRPDWLQWIFDDPELQTHRAEIPELPSLRIGGLGDYVENIPIGDERWWSDERVERFEQSLSSVQKERLENLKRSTAVKYRTAYRRMRNSVPVWEVRPDDISGCLRTARGGSSKQAVVRVGDGFINVRWMTSVEYANLMGAPDFDLGDARDSQVMFGFGDAVVVPAVEWLAANYLLPLSNGTLDAQEETNTLATSGLRATR